VFEAAIDAPASAVEAPRRCRKRTLTKVNRRSILGKRITELTALFVDAVKADELSPLLRLKIDEAAQLKALAELARGDYMRDRRGTLDDIVRLERRAEQAVAALGLKRAVHVRLPSPSSAAATPAPDLSQLSNSQLDWLYALLAEGPDREVAEALREATEARRLREAMSAPSEVETAVSGQRGAADG
jgi:hypothetical protein